jgi:hypothetical protein
VKVVVRSGVVVKVKVPIPDVIVQVLVGVGVLVRVGVSVSKGVTMDVADHVGLTTGVGFGFQTDCVTACNSEEFNKA